MEIKARSKYDFKSIKVLTHVITYKKRNPKKSFLFMTLYTLLLLGFILLMMYFDVGDDWGWLFALSIAIIILDCFMYFGLPWIQYRALVKMKGMENEFTFGDETMKVISKNAEYQGEAEIKYSLIPKVMETSKHFFIFQSKNQVYIVDKATISGGTSEDIRNKLGHVPKKKYIVCKY